MRFWVPPLTWLAHQVSAHVGTDTSSQSRSSFFGLMALFPPILLWTLHFALCFTSYLICLKICILPPSHLICLSKWEESALERKLTNLAIGRDGKICRLRERKKIERKQMWWSTSDIWWLGIVQPNLQDSKIFWSCSANEYSTVKLVIEKKREMREKK